MARVFLLTLGCAKNRVDAEMLLGFAAAAGHEVVATAEGADVIVVNTCAFIEPAREESIGAILDAAEVKREHPGARLVVTGCLPQRYREELAEELPEVDLFLGTGALDGLAAALARPDFARGPRLQVGEPQFAGADHAPRFRSTGRGSAYVKVSEGCSRRCSYCAIPEIRGPQRSRPVAAIEAEVRALVADGAVEVNLIAQDLTAYGRDFRGPRARRPTLATLVARLAAISDLAWLRLLYAYPTGVTDDLLAVMADAPAVVPYLDLPLQHIDDRLLKRMRRGYDAAAVEALVARLRERVPGIVLRTSFIVGFPGEDEAAFRRLCDFVRCYRIERVGVFPFSAEEGTRAATLTRPVPPEEAQARAEALMAVQRGVSRAYHESLVGRTVPVLVEGESEESEFLCTGRMATQAPEVDGVVHLGFGPEALPAQEGELRQATLEAAEDYDLATLQ
jgi:ribosomal protein S12 methylthiotransferase